jgi:hypothetical protein
MIWFDGEAIKEFAQCTDCDLAEDERNDEQDQAQDCS